MLKLGHSLGKESIGMAGGLRPQAYVHNPIEWVDPLGLAGCEGKSNSAGNSAETSNPAEEVQSYAVPFKPLSSDAKKVLKEKQKTER